MTRATSAAPVDDLFALPPGVDEGDMRPAVIAERAERLARRTDPETSKRAARAAVRLALSHGNIITGALWKPMTPAELAKITGLSVVQIDRRRHELIEAGLIRLTGVERDGYQEIERIDAAFIGATA